MEREGGSDGPSERETFLVGRFWWTRGGLAGRDGWSEGGYFAGTSCSFNFSFLQFFLTCSQAESQPKIIEGVFSERGKGRWVGNLSEACDGPISS